MNGRLTVWAALAAAWLGGTVLGVASAALRTDVGRTLVADAAVTVVNQRIAGTMTVGAIGGSFLDGLTVDDVAIRGADGLELVVVGRLRLRYRLSDLLSGRLVLGQLVLERPTVTLMQEHPGGPFNLDQIFASRPGAAAARRGRPPLIAFRDVQITDGTIVVDTPADPPAEGTTSSNAGRRRQIRRVDRLQARFPFARLSSPLPFERAVALDVAAFAATVSDPGLAITAAQGLVNIWGDSLTLDLVNLALPDTRARLRGSLAWPADTLLLNLEVRAARAATDEVRGLVPELPRGLHGRGDFTIRSVSGDVLEVIGEGLAVEGLGGGGRLGGRLGVRLGPRDGWSQLATRLEVNDFDLEYVRGFLDPLPLAGRLTGRVAMDGPREALRLTASTTFRDSLVDDWPETSLIGDGVVRLGVPGTFVFDSFTVQHADVSLASVRRLVPAVELRGRLRGVGRLDGPWLNPTFDGELRHEDATLPESAVRGRIRLDAEGDTLGVWADVDLDPMSLDGLAGSFPTLEAVGGFFSGRLQLAGYLDSLAVDATLRGRGGAIDARGALILEGERQGAHRLDILWRNVDLHAFHPALPETRLYASSAAAGVGLAGDARWRVSLRVDTSAVRGIRVDSAQALLTLADSVLTLGDLRLIGDALLVDGRGAIGLATPRRGVLTLAARSDSLGVLDPLLSEWLGSPDTTDGGGLTLGSFTTTLRLEGALDAYRATAEFDARRLSRGGVFVRGARGGGSWESVARRVRVETAIDSMNLGGVGLSAVEARADGPLDSVAWYGRGRLGDGSFIAGGRWLRDSTSSLVPIDSLGVLLATGAWFLDTAAVVAVTDSGVDLRSVTLASANGPGAVSLDGRLPFAGPADLAGTVRALPLRDLWLLLQREYEQTEGELSGSLRMTGTARAPAIELALSLRDARFDTFRAPFIEGTATFRDRRLTGDVSLWRSGEQILLVNLDLPVDLAISGATERLIAGDLTVRAVASGVDLTFLDALTPAVRRSGGTLDADFGIAGSWDRPVLRGQLAVRDGAASFPSLGVRHEALNARLVLSGDTIRVESFSVRSGQGTAQMDGYVRLERLTRPILDLRITARNFRSIAVRDFLTLTASGDLELRGPFFNATLTGQGTATRGVLHFADLVTKDVVNLEDPLFREFVDTSLIAQKLVAREFENRFLDSLRIDSLRLEMGSEVWLRSTEANIQLQGVVTANKLRDRYRFTGTLETPRGTYRLELIPGLVTREFTVTRGEVRYLGTPDLNADLDIDARHVVRVPRGDDVTVSVHIGGTLYEPKLTLSSEIRPAISETEIISYLLFGASSVQALAGVGGAENRRLQQVAVENVVGALSGQLEASLISNLGIPLDYLQIRTAGAGGLLSGTEIALGKQFTIFGTSAFLTASPRICSRQAVVNNLGASLEFRLSRQWLLAASVDPLRPCDAQGGEGATYQVGFDIFWQKSY